MSGEIALFRKPFYFLRHGETELNADRLVAGSIDTELTGFGRQQAVRAAAVLARQPITAVYSSPLRRARDTAAPIAELLKLPIVVIDEIAERNWGVLEGQPRGSRIRGTTPAGAEPSDAFRARVLAGLAKIDSAVPLIVAHSGIFRVLCRTLGVAENEAPVTNALPLKFEPLVGGAWKLIPLTQGALP